MAHRMIGLLLQSVALVTDKSNNHAVEIEEEHQEVEAKLDKGFLEILNLSQFSSRCHISQPLVPSLTFLCTFNLRKISVASRRCWFS